MIKLVIGNLDHWCSCYTYVLVGSAQAEAEYTTDPRKDVNIYQTKTVFSMGQPKIWRVHNPILGPPHLKVPGWISVLVHPCDRPTLGSPLLSCIHLLTIVHHWKWLHLCCQTQISIDIHCENLKQLQYSYLQCQYARTSCNFFFFKHITPITDQLLRLQRKKK